LLLTGICHFISYTITITLLHYYYSIIQEIQSGHLFTEQTSPSNGGARPKTKGRKR